MNTALRRLFVIISLAVGLFMFGLVASPSVIAQKSDYCSTESNTFLSFPTWYKYLTPSFTGGECKLDISFPSSLPKILLAVFEILLRVSGLLAMVFVVYGGFQYLISAGEPDKAKAGRTTILNALVGMMISILATVIVNLVGRGLTT